MNKANSIQRSTVPFPKNCLKGKVRFSLQTHSYVARPFQLFSYQPRSKRYLEELNSMKIENMEIKDRISWMVSPWRSLQGMRFDLKLLHSALMTHVQDRVFRLSGKGSRFSSLQLVTNIEGPQHTPTVVPLMTGRRSSRKSKIIGLIRNKLQLDTLISRIPSYLQNHGGVSTNGQTIVQNSVGGSENQLGKMVIHGGRLRGELHGDELSVVKGLISSDECIPIWNSLQRQVLAFATEGPKFTPRQADSLVEILQSYYLLGDYIYTYGLLPASFIKSMAIFRFPTIAHVLSTYVKALCARNRDYFDESDSVIPQMEFLTTARSVAHFHRSLKALPARYHFFVVYLALWTTLNHAPFYFVQDPPSGSFSQVCAPFRELPFVNRARRLSRELVKTPDMDYRSNIKSLSAVTAIEDLAKFFHAPPRATRSDLDRVEFQMVFYILDFVDKYFQPIIKTMIHRKEISPIFPEQLEYMRGYLRFFHHRTENPASFGFSKQDRAFLKMYLGWAHQDASLREWIKTVPLTLLPHVGWSDCFGILREQKYNLWMCITR
ncbi:hypothetical protein Pst134EA_002885 [Puccinia striiformis f. sp. tritici]|uniref:hypothetical protein n=1 Tax=Puccinia striiformis f. sp. tritici TaxID=168172 RepID=UPI00200896CC|nr:hypothetical protein Pst134EA_002885 [Puccinia striiformis f. sp. tritici]KAH9472262.1 hypothetical protein Pst134EA_002885 [Puccinia striiformis f. sp. tritici]